MVRSWFFGQGERTLRLPGVSGDVQIASLHLEAKAAQRLGR